MDEIGAVEGDTLTINALLYCRGGVVSLTSDVPFPDLRWLYRLDIFYSPAVTGDGTMQLGTIPDVVVPAACASLVSWCATTATTDVDTRGSALGQ